MTKFVFVLALSMFFAGAVLAEAPTMSVYGEGGGTYDSDRTVIWSDPPDALGSIGSAQEDPISGLDTRLANDFEVATETTICLWRWWGGFWNGDPVAPDGFLMEWFMDAGCVPDVAPMATYQADSYNQQPYETEVEYSVEYDVAFGPGLYWFSTAALLTFPPQWGRLAATGIQVCDTVFRSAYFGYPDWTPAIIVFGYAFDASQEMEDECEPTAVEESSWGAIKSLYR
jgi:hypothetical protein